VCCATRNPELSTCVRPAGCSVPHAATGHVDSRRLRSQHNVDRVEAHEHQDAPMLNKRRQADAAAPAEGAPNAPAPNSPSPGDLNIRAFAIVVTVTQAGL